MCRFFVQSLVTTRNVLILHPRGTGFRRSRNTKKEQKSVIAYSYMDLQWHCSTIFLLSYPYISKDKKSKIICYERDCHLEGGTPLESDIFAAARVNWAGMMEH